MPHLDRVRVRVRLPHGSRVQLGLRLRRALGSAPAGMAEDGEVGSLRPEDLGDAPLARLYEQRERGGAPGQG